jgi:hypothetical protein
MTEAEWLAHERPREMLAWLQSPPAVGMGPGGLVPTAGPASERKLRLFACACCRDAWGLLTEERSRLAVTATERFADGLASDEERDAAWMASRHAIDDARLDARDAARMPWLAAQVRDYAQRVDDVLHRHETAAGGRAAPHMAGSAIKQFQAVALRDIVGNPFCRRPSLGHQAEAAAVALAAYRERHLPGGHLDAVRLAVLADALEEGGCDDGPLLAHLRGPGPHWRGCWAVDLVLGKE